jgi:hypothetical protein
MVGQRAVGDGGGGEARKGLTEYEPRTKAEGRGERAAEKGMERAEINNRNGRKS